MSAVWMDGRTVAQTWKESIAKEAAAMIEAGVTPHLAVVVVGENPASQVYVRNKENACKKAGIRSSVIRLSECCKQDELERVVISLNEDHTVHGILVQLPLPEHLDEARVLALINPKKDVDGFHAMNSGRLMNGQPGFVPCTPLGVMRLLEAYGITIEGKHAVILGRSNIVGKPMAMLLLAHNATVTICHSKSENLTGLTRQADILVAAVGKAGFVKGDMVKPGAVVIDVGINRVDGGIVGDVDAQSVGKIAAYLTPVPGGVGQMTIAMLLANTLQAAKSWAEDWR